VSGWRAGIESTLEFYDDEPVGSVRGYVDVGASRELRDQGADINGVS
jgi:hypothetical protein